MSTLPIVVLTGLEDHRIALDALRLGAQDYLCKNQVDPDSLARCLRYAIERKQLETEIGRTNQEVVD